MAATSHRARLTARRQLAGDYFELTFAVVDVLDFEYAPGQFVVLKIADGRQPAALRAYSLASAPRGNEFKLIIKHVRGTTENGANFEGRGSGWLHALSLGETVELLGPSGQPALREGSLAPLILAGTGTGLAPLFAIAEWLTRTASPRPVTLYFGVRYAAELFYEHELATLAAANPQLKIHVAVSRPSEEWGGRRGRLNELLAADFAAGLPAEAEAVVCGGREATTGICAALAALGLPPGQLHLETY